MLPRNHPDRTQITFDDHRLVANAGLLLPATLAQHLGLWGLVDHHLDLGSAPGRANAGDKMMTLVASALARGEAQPQGHVGLAGAAVADGDGDNERTPPAAWHSAPELKSAPGDQAPADLRRRARASTQAVPSVTSNTAPRVMGAVIMAVSAKASG